MIITFLGTGTSVGVPTIGCDCKTCLSDDPRDKRLRSSALIRNGSHNVLIDASTDFRSQALRTGIRHIDAILFTHAHADHCFGLDDMRPMMARHGAIPCYATRKTWKELERVYAYIHNPTPFSSVPRITQHDIDGDFSIFGLDISPLMVFHGKLPVTAYRIGKFAYVTDCSLIPDEACDRLQQLDMLVIDTLRYKHHPTHLSFEEALAYISRLKPRRALLTHLGHDLMYSEIAGLLPPGVEVAYDGLEVEIL